MHVYSRLKCQQTAHEAPEVQDNNAPYSDRIAVAAAAVAGVAVVAAAIDPNA